jgi:hypothetical protein
LGAFDAGVAAAIGYGTIAIAVAAAFLAVIGNAEGRTEIALGVAGAFHAGIIRAIWTRGIAIAVGAAFHAFLGHAELPIRAEVAMIII